MADLVAVAIVCILFWKRRELAEAIDNFNNRGGPRTPMHPSPANDAALLSRRKAQS